MSRFTKALVVSPLADGKTWLLLEPFAYDVGEEGSGQTIDVEVGFMTDFTSIPRPFWAVLPRWGKYGNAAVLHDWLYSTQEYPRARADAIMFEAMGVLRVAAWQRYAIYWGVRGLGWIAWRRSQWDREAGVERVRKDGELKAGEMGYRPGLVQSFWRHFIGGGTKSK